ncbi:hypothetical protein IEQ34_007143 [Dendrobium chrysotoxum]|uniref:Uncharacterized protein n=1 Tax=Dendrobium chrysotoxum TaxID=161865 RepID=A0AAV7H917_DENCH|nr:hypothetical protein IEQ34_007143 [Dendrobium chrysotoxum]
MALKSLVEKMVELFERAADKLGCDRAARARLLALGDTGGMLSFLHNKKMIRDKKKESIAKKTTKMREDEEEEVWRRTIMMGEKCQPLEFSGVIYYDADGKRAATAPRTPLRGNVQQSALHCF